MAWNTLQEPDRQIDLVITDLEMPNIDGLELTRKIKQTPHLANLRVIAVTSLASEADQQRGLEAGVDEYQIKLDRDRLIARVQRFVARARHYDTTAPSAVRGKGQEL